MLDPNQLTKGINKTLFLAARLELGKESRDNDRMLNTSRPFDLEGQLQNWDLEKGSKRLDFQTRDRSLLLMPNSCQEILHH